jgi:DNA-binding response OmpR family regulator
VTGDTVPGDAEPGGVVWGRDGFVEPRTIDVHLARLRGKFLSAMLPPPEVEAVRGVGYRFREPER